MKFIAYLMVAVLVVVCRVDAARVKGTVLDNSTRLPVAGAEVGWTDGGPSLQTGVDGTFAIEAPPEPAAGKMFQLKFKADHYWSKQIPVDASSGASVMVVLQSAKQRLIVTSDIGGTDPDDQQSMVHLLVCSNEVDLEGIIPGLAWLPGKIGVDAVAKIVDAYGQALPNLRVHADDYPSLDAIRSIIKPGQSEPRMAGVGEGKDSPGSDLIIAMVDKNDPRPVWLNAWGGTNTIAQALWKVKQTRSPEELAKFVAKIRIFDILGQDDAGAWMAKTFPDLCYIRSQAVYGWAPSDQWIKANVQGKGALGSQYPNRIWAAEGDSPAFMHVLTTGLHDPNQIDQGGWGGRFGLEKKPGLRSMEIALRSGIDEKPFDPYLMFTDTPEGIGAIKRWKSDIFNDFQARMNWAVHPNKIDCNHHPVACVNDDTTRQVLELNALAGSKLKLNAKGSSDPDGDKLTYDWAFYSEPSTYTGAVTIDGHDTAFATVSIPTDAGGKTLHLILRVGDSGTPSLAAYRRLIVKVR